MDQEAETAMKSGLTADTLKVAVRDFNGADPILMVGNRLYLYAVRVCQQAYGAAFREHVGIAINSTSKYGWELIDPRSL